jgi:hypothetical protein
MLIIGAYNLFSKPDNSDNNPTKWSVIDTAQFDQSGNQVDQMGAARWMHRIKVSTNSSHDLAPTAETQANYLVYVLQ